MNHQLHQDSGLFLLPLEQVIDEYTQIELRGLRQARAALPPAQQRALAGITANLEAIGVRLCQLNREQGGLALR